MRGQQIMCIDILLSTLHNIMHLLAVAYERFYNQSAGYWIIMSRLRIMGQLHANILYVAVMHPN